VFGKLSFGSTSLCILCSKEKSPVRACEDSNLGRLFGNQLQTEKAVYASSMYQVSSHPNFLSRILLKNLPKKSRLPWKSKFPFQHSQQPDIGHLFGAL
jgi:hypothetical protein